MHWTRGKDAVELTLLLQTEFYPGASLYPIPPENLATRSMQQSIPNQTFLALWFSSSHQQRRRKKGKPCKHRLCATHRIAQILPPWTLQILPELFCLNFPL
jgi:hypothetical protein